MPGPACVLQLPSTHLVLNPPGLTPLPSVSAAIPRPRTPASIPTYHTCSVITHSPHASLRGMALSTASRSKMSAPNRCSVPSLRQAQGG